MKSNIIFIAVVLFGNCNSNKQVSSSVTSIDNDSTHKNIAENKIIDFSVSPCVFIYKTKKDYNDMIPVTLSEDKSKIVSYPSTKDIYYNEKLSLPDMLADGFLLDNRGINKDVAFLNISYEDYSRQIESPLVSDMMKMIIDKDPLTVMYNCGSRYQYKDIINDLNKIIEDKQLDKFKKVY